MRIIPDLGCEVGLCNVICEFDAQRQIRDDCEDNCDDRVNRVFELYNHVSGVESFLTWFYMQLLCKVFISMIVLLYKFYSFQS